MNISSIINAGKTFHERRRRTNRIGNFMKNELRITVPTLTQEQKKMVDEVWKGIHVDYMWFAFFNLFNEEGKEWTPLYIPSNLYYSLVDMHYTDYKGSAVIEDKNFNSLFFYDVKQPITVVRNMGGNIMDENYKIITIDDMHKRLSPNCSYVAKPSIGTGAGRRILVYKAGETEKFSEFVKYVDSFKNCVVQKYATQHEQLASIYSESLNSIRIITFYHNGMAKALSTIIRMGAGGNRVDNATAGGCFVGVDEKGYLKQVGFNDYGERFECHPTTGVPFKGHYIPDFDRFIKLAETLHNRLVNFSKLISWDFAIDAEGDPILIEKNLSEGGLSFHQQCNGPLFGGMTQEIIEEVFDKKARLLSRIL